MKGWGRRARLFCNDKWREARCGVVNVQGWNTKTSWFGKTSRTVGRKSTTTTTVISFILTREIFLHLYRHGDRFYNRYINKTEKRYLDDDDTGMKPKHFLQRGSRYTSGCDPIQKFWDRYRKIARDNFGRKRKGLAAEAGGWQAGGDAQVVGASKW